MLGSQKLPIGVEALAHGLGGELHVDLDEESAIVGAICWFIGHKVLVEVVVGPKLFVG